MGIDSVGGEEALAAIPDAGPADCVADHLRLCAHGGSSHRFQGFLHQERDLGERLGRAEAFQEFLHDKGFRASDQEYAGSQPVQPCGQLPYAYPSGPGDQRAERQAL